MLNLADIGHNNPPVQCSTAAAYDFEIDQIAVLLSDTLSGGVIDNDAKEAAIDDLFDQLRRIASNADRHRAAEKKPHDDAGKAVQATWKPIIDKAKRFADECRVAITPYRIAKQHAADKAALEAKAAAELAAIEARKALHEADDLQAQYEAELLIADAIALTHQAKRDARAPTGLRTSWDAEVTNYSEALRHYASVSGNHFKALIDKLAALDARSTRPKVPGVTYHERKTAT